MPGGPFGLASRGAGPAQDVTSQFGAQAVGRVQSVKEKLYAITTERRLTHPAIVEMREAAKREIFA